MDRDIILEELVHRGKVTREDIDICIKEAERNEAAVEFLNSIHAAFCELNHDNGECEWYAEDVLPEELWFQPVHAKWRSSFLSFISSLNLPKFDEETVTKEPTGSTDLPLTCPK